MNDVNEVLSGEITILSTEYKNYGTTPAYKISARMDYVMATLHFVVFQKDPLFKLAGNLTVGNTYVIKGVVNPTNDRKLKGYEYAHTPSTNILLNVFYIGGVSAS